MRRVTRMEHLGAGNGESYTDGALGGLDMGRVTRMEHLGGLDMRRVIRMEHLVG